MEKSPAQKNQLLQHVSGELLFGLLDNPNESLILIDQAGIVRFLSSTNESFFQVNREEAIGRHVTEINPDTELLETLKSGKAEIGRVMTMKGRQRIIARIPIFHQGQIIGAAGKVMFAHPEKLKELYERIETLESKLDYYKKELYQAFGSRYTFDNIIGQSDAILKAKTMAIQAADTDSAVIISGESGTGKELFAHAIHQAGRRRDQNFIRVNSASIPGELIESELFGYEAGAFTGANKNGKPGKFELADKGTIFFDEIGDMPLNMQVKLLRVLQEKEIERVGGQKPRKIDFRFICATNRNVEKMISSGAFRLDLYYRINVMNVSLPPLRAIKDDIPLFFKEFLTELSGELNKKVKPVAANAMTLLQNYAWPGNMRELRNIAERALILSRGETITLDDLPPVVRETTGSLTDGSDRLPMLKAIMAETEKQAVARALELTGDNRAAAAKMLGIHRTGLYQKMKKYGMS
ncbi:sigma 54-interacting transcriptional regulator [bacterium]|nr:sigma 54-interacting transcriptional regulator [bacterium]